MEILLTWRELLLAVILASLVYLLEYTLFSRWRARKGAPPSQAAHGEIQALRDELAQLRQRLDTLESRNAANHAQEIDNLSSIYEHALAYAREGLPAQEIAALCGISISEATLIVAMQQSKN